MKEFEGLTLEQIKEKITEQFYSVYGHYESTSGKMWFEVFHRNSADADNSEFTKGDVIWRKGIGEEMESEEIMSREDAITRYMRAIKGGFSQVFKAVTAEDIDKGNELRLMRQSIGKREGWLGTYLDGKRFLRISQFREADYYIELGYDGIVTETRIASEYEVRLKLELALDEGFVKEGTNVEDDNEYNPLEAFGIFTESKPKPVKEKSDLPNELFEMFS